MTNRVRSVKLTSYGYNARPHGRGIFMNWLRGKGSAAPAPAPTRKPGQGQHLGGPPATVAPVPSVLPSFVPILRTPPEPSFHVATGSTDMVRAMVLGPYRCPKTPGVAKRKGPAMVARLGPGAQTTLAMELVKCNASSTPVLVSVRCKPRRGPAATSSPPSTAGLCIKAVQFEAPGRVGDYGWMLHQPQYAKAVMIFNENVEQLLSKSTSRGGGNAIARPYRQSGRAMGVPTGFLRSGGFVALEQQCLRDVRYLLHLYPPLCSLTHRLGACACDCNGCRATGHDGEAAD